jgi:type I restriction enzyme R subunit
MQQPVRLSSRPDGLLGLSASSPLLDQPIADGSDQVYISDHEDALRRVEHGYGAATRPEDYLESFGEYIRTHLNEIPALLLVVQRPRELTRKQLRELKLVLDQAGYSETAIRTAWRDLTNQDIAASIIGYVRQQALGSPLVPYEERVSRAMRQILSSRAWTPPQRKWLERIGRQLEVETVVDRESLDSGQFRQQGGGFDRLNRIFEGELDTLLTDIQDTVWRDIA